MNYKRISDFKDMLSFNFTCPFCNKQYTVEQVWNHEKTMSFCRYIFRDDCCEHLILWESYESGIIYPDEIDNLDWFTRVSGLPFRVWDVLQEIINNDIATQVYKAYRETLSNKTIEQPRIGIFAKSLL